MRKSVFFILLATAAMPALAAAQDQEESGARDSDRGARSEYVQGKGDKSSLRAGRSERSVSDQAVSVQRVERAERQVLQVNRQTAVASPHHGEEGSTGSHRGYHRDANRDHRELHATDPSRREHRVYHREQDRDHRTNHRSWNQGSRRAGHGEYHRDLTQEHGELHAGDPTRREHRDWHRDVTRQHDRRHSAWDRNWRSNRSYDWRSYRSRYGSLYNLGRYYDPYGYGYRRFSIGLTLGSGYYRNSNYWLNDPWQYRLPQVYGPYRWVRYYNDALLVDMYSGQVVDVIHGFFW